MGLPVSPHPKTPSHLLPHPILLDCPNALALSALFHASNLDCWSVSNMIIYVFQGHSRKPSHPLLPQSPKVCSLYLCLFCCLTYRVILETAMATHSSSLAWKIPWMEEPGRLQSMGSLRVRHDWATSLWLFTFMPWWRKWQPIPAFLPGESQGQGSLVGCRLWGRTESDMTEVT